MTIPTLDITGNLTKDADITFNERGTATARGTVAANRSKRDDQGNWQNVETHFQRFIAWGDNAQLLADAGQGAQVRLVGRLVTDQWEDRQGEKHSMPNLKVDFASVVKRKDQQNRGGGQGGNFGGGGQGSQGGYNAQPSQQSQQGGWGQQDAWAGGGYDDSRPPF